MMTFGTIADRAAELDKAAVGHVPDDVLAVMRADRARLAASGVPADVATAGTAVPDVDLLDAQGVSTTLHAAIGPKPAVVVFYRGAWCPYCNVALATYQAQLLPELNQRGVALVAISPQAPDGSLSMQEKQNLTFTVLSDPGNSLARELGILAPSSDEVLEAQGRLGLDLTVLNADGTAVIPMPTTLILDARHVLRWIDVHPDYGTRSETADILAALSEMGR